MLKSLLNIAQNAGKIILSYYHQKNFISQKNDSSPLTEADTASHNLIFNALKLLYPTIPIISEESSEQTPYAIRKKWTEFFLIDPLDGTKEFIQRNDEFTVNIALIQQGLPILGIVHAPALNITYYAQKNHGAFKLTEQKTIQLIKHSLTTETRRIITSRSHLNSDTKKFIQSLNSQDIKFITAGSALKFGLLAEGVADIYPRLAPTMEWDTAAGHAILNEMDGAIIQQSNHIPLQYNKAELINPNFIAYRNKNDAGTPATF